MLKVHFDGKSEIPAIVHKLMLIPFFDMTFSEIVAQKNAVVQLIL